jgi:hypothetical protein
MTFTNNTFAYNLRGTYEEEYSDEIMSNDIIETLVHQYEQQCMSHGIDPSDFIDQSRILMKTLKWSSSFNRNEAC